MLPAASSRLAALLRGTGLFNDSQIEELALKQRSEDGCLTAAVAELGYAREDQFLEALARQMGVGYRRIRDDEKVPAEVLGKVPAKAVFQYNVLPLAADGAGLTVATAEPFRPGLADALRLASGMRVKFLLAPPGDIEACAKKWYGVGAETLAAMGDGFDDGSTDLSLNNLGDLDQDASVVKFVNQIILECRRQNGTDIHIEPMENDLRIRYRIDGVLHPTPLPPQMKRFQSAIISRIKVMAGMDIAEKRLPQDGRISVKIHGEEIDVRVSTMPISYGESVSLRLLLRSSGMIGMDKLGLFPDDEELLGQLIRKPHGILLVTGPTGSGKSTSLYAWLHTINSVDKRILTVEDPDVIMVGEIRDQETADIAIRAALTGHLVFSTLHTNDAVGAVNRLVDMGIEPFLVSSSVEALTAQRLIRRLCPHCKRPWKVDKDFLRRVGFPVERLGEGTIYEAAGCEACRGSGYAGRTGIYEILPIDDDIRQMINERESSVAIKQYAVEHGMRTLRMDGWRKVLAGITTLSEVINAEKE